MSARTVCSVILVFAVSVRAAEEKASPPALISAEAVQRVVAAAKPSVVVVRTAGRDGKHQGIGTGFVISADGLIATNYHVIGEARPISVKFADGKEADAVAVHSADRKLDLAILRIDAKNLRPLELGDSDSLKAGTPVVALGNPHGLAHSVVTGAVSGTREIDGRTMIQIAIPIEPGNSGGPMMDLAGKVYGLLTLKSAVTDNLGFAVPVNQLKPLMAKPNPIPMSRWLTIGALDAREWTPLFGARWRQRAGRITADGLGQGFGGRSLCLLNREPPALPYEMAVDVKLDDEAGAAGLVFHADGNDLHYGFYPSGGKLRLSRFEGPNPMTWNILQDVPSDAYRPGDWNTIKVRFEKGKFTCSVNDVVVVTSTDTRLAVGKVGLAKFRDTKAEFRGFRLADKVPAIGAGAEVAKRVEAATADLPPRGPIPGVLVEKLVPEKDEGPAALRAQAQRLEQQAGQLRKLARRVHEARVGKDIAAALSAKPADLLGAALLIARLDNEEVDVEAYRREAARMATEISTALPKGSDEAAKVSALNKYLFADNGFHGSRHDYHHASNSYLNEVIDDREGLPLTLSVLWLDLAGRLGLKAEGVPLPGHFVVRHVGSDGKGQLIDVYEGGTAISRDEAALIVRNTADVELKEEHLKPATQRQIIVRMLHNLLRVAGDAQDTDKAIRYLDVIVAINPESGHERWMRAVLLWRSGRSADARLDVNWLLEHEPDGVDLERVRALEKVLAG